MNRRTGRPDFREALTKEEQVEHLRQLCLLRRHLSDAMRTLKPLCDEHRHLHCLMQAIDRHQTRYTGNPGHFHTGHVALIAPAND